MKLRTVQISGDGEEAVVILGMQSESGPEQVSYRYPGRTQVTLTAADSGDLRLNITVNPLNRRKELTEKNVPQQRFDK